MMKMWPVAMDDELKSKESKAVQNAAYAMLAEFRKKKEERKKAEENQNKNIVNTNT